MAKVVPLPAQIILIYLVCYLVALLKPFHPSGGVYHSLLTGEKWVALTAQLDLECFPGRADGKGITAGTDRFSVGIIFGMNLIFHNNIKIPLPSLETKHLLRILILSAYRFAI